MMKNESRGYASKFIRQVEQADARLLGVRLAKVCIARDIPALAVAATLGVSKQTVYAWFVGRSQPHASQTKKLEALLEQYKRQPPV